MFKKWLNEDDNDVTIRDNAEDALYHIKECYEEINKLQAIIDDIDNYEKGKHPILNSYKHEE